MATTASRLRIETIAPAVGAIAHDIDLREELDAGTVAELKRVLHRQGAIFFRGQDLTREQVARFMACFGPLGTDPFSVAALTPPTPEHSVHDMPTTGNARATAVWHMDSTLAQAPAAYLSLRALQLPESGGGDTCWGSMYAAYDTLSEPVKAFIDGLYAEHSAYRTLPLLGGSNTAYLQEEMRNVHPVVRVHPVTGRKALFVNELWTESIVGLSKHESDSVLAMLWKHSMSPEFTMRWRWGVNDLVLWDNMAFQHYAVRDYTGNRVLQKAYVAGEKPVGPR